MTNATTKSQSAQLAEQLVSGAPSTCDAIYELAKAIRALAVDVDCEVQAEIAEALFGIAYDNREVEEATF